MSDDFISSGIKGVLDYGINLKLESEEEEMYYIQKMCEFFNEETDFKAYLSGDRSFDVELDRNTPILEVTINNSNLTMIPYSEDIFEVFTLILSFIVKKHMDVITELREPTEHKIEDLKDISPTTQIEEDSSDDDYEWI